MGKPVGGIISIELKPMFFTSNSIYLYLYRMCTSLAQFVLFYEIFLPTSVIIFKKSTNMATFYRLDKL